jgi:hypothetical protein
MLAPFVATIHQWALLQLRSLPIGMRIDCWIAETYPGLRDLQEMGLAVQQQQNADILSKKLGHLNVPLHLLAIIPGAKIGKCWVFVEIDLLDHIRSQYPRRALQGEHERNITCHSSNAKVLLGGGSNSLPAMDDAYSKALGLTTKSKPRNCTTS